MSLTLAPQFKDLTFHLSRKLGSSTPLWTLADSNPGLPEWPCSFWPRAMFAFRTRWIAPCTRSLLECSPSKGWGAMGRIAYPCRMPSTKSSSPLSGTSRDRSTCLAAFSVSSAASCTCLTRILPGEEDWRGQHSPLRRGTKNNAARGELMLVRRRRGGCRSKLTPSMRRTVLAEERERDRTQPSTKPCRSSGMQGKVQEVEAIVTFSGPWRKVSRSLLVLCLPSNLGLIAPCGFGTNRSPRPMSSGSECPPHAEEQRSSGSRRALYRPISLTPKMKARSSSRPPRSSITARSAGQDGSYRISHTL